MRELFRTLPLMCVVLLAPVVPFLLLGGKFDEWLRGMAEDPPSPGATAALVIGLLSTDILLPIPSSVISTMAGWQLGWWRGTLATWIGMNVGAVLGFALARRWGRPMARWFSKAEDLDRIEGTCRQYGPLVLVMCRAVPVFAEASVLWMGAHHLSWQRFLPAVLASNLGIALAYAAFGDFAQQNQWLPLALGISIGIPVLLALVAERWLPGRNSGEHQETAGSRFLDRFRPVTDRFLANYAGYFRDFRWYLLAIVLAAVLDGASTIRFMLIDGAEHELHPAIRLFSQVLGPVVGPIGGKLFQLFAIFLVTVYLRYYARYIFVAATLIYLWAAWYNVWGGKLYTPLFFNYLPL